MVVRFHFLFLRLLKLASLPIAAALWSKPYECATGKRTAEISAFLPKYRHCAPSVGFPVSPMRFDATHVPYTNRRNRAGVPFIVLTRWVSEIQRIVAVRTVIYEAFVEGGLQAPKRLARTVPDLYFDPKLRGVPMADDLESLEPAYFGVKQLDPIPLFKAIASRANSWKPTFHSRSRLRGDGHFCGCQIRGVRPV